MALTRRWTARVSATAAGALRAFIREESGEDLLEYAFLGAFIATAGYVALNEIVPALGAAYQSWTDPAGGAPGLWDPAPPR